jgi:hypothetical protein
MRHRSIDLTTGPYTDGGLLDLRSAVEKLCPLQLEVRLAVLAVTPVQHNACSAFADLEDALASLDFHSTTVA